MHLRRDCATTVSVSDQREEWLHLRRMHIFLGISNVFTQQFARNGWLIAINITQAVKQRSSVIFVSIILFKLDNYTLDISTTLFMCATHFYLHSSFFALSVELLCPPLCMWITCSERSWSLSSSGLSIRMKIKSNRESRAGLSFKFCKIVLALL